MIFFLLLLLPLSPLPPLLHYTGLTWAISTPLKKKKKEKKKKVNVFLGCFQSELHNLSPLFPSLLLNAVRE